MRVEGFQADIVEVLPDRRMFTRGETWLDEPQLLTVPNGNCNGASPDWTPSLSPTETLVDEQWERDFRVPTAVLPPQTPENTKDTAWLDSTGGLLRFIAVFVAVLLLLNVPRDDGDLTGPAGTLFSRITRLLDVRQTLKDRESIYQRIVSITEHPHAPISTSNRPSSDAVGNNFFIFVNISSSFFLCSQGTRLTLNLTVKGIVPA